MGVELPALRVLYAIAYSAITILAWEAGKSIVLTHSYDCGGEESCSWRRAAQLQVQIGASNPREDTNSIVADSGDERVDVLSDTAGDPSSVSRQCIVRWFEHGTKSHERNVHSQLGEDGILDLILKCVNPVNRTYVELGATDGVSGATSSLPARGWTDLLGSGAANTTSNLHAASPTGDSVASLLQEHDAPPAFDLLAVHAGHHTFWVLHAALQAGYHPRVIAAQVNPHFHPADVVVPPHTPDAADDVAAAGAAAGALDILLENLGYTTVAINQAARTVFAVSTGTVGAGRLLPMSQIAAGVASESLCQNAGSCGGVTEWLQVDASAAQTLQTPRSEWYDSARKLGVRCMEAQTPGGNREVRWGAPAGAGEVPDFLPGVAALLPCLPVADATSLATKMVAAQSGAQHRAGPAGQAATAANVTDCERRPEAEGSMKRKRKCLHAAFAGGTGPQEARSSRYSQYNEDAIIDAIFACIYPHDRFYVEFGVEGGDECTTRHLREDGWAGLMMDGGNFRPEMNLQQEFFNAEGIAYQFAKHSVPLRFDHLTIDIDQNTFWVLHSVLRAGFRPRVVVSEINRNFHPEDAFVVPYNYSKMWDGTMAFGASSGALSALLSAFGYHTVAIDQDQINMYAVQSCEVGEEPLFSPAELTAGLQRAGPCVGLHQYAPGQYLQVSDEVAGMLTQPREVWYDTMPRWWVDASEPREQNPERPIRILTGKPMNESGPQPEVPRLELTSKSVDSCAPIAEATDAAGG